MAAIPPRVLAIALAMGLPSRGASAQPADPHTSTKVALSALSGAALGLLVASVSLEISARGIYDQARLEPDDAHQASLWHTANHRRYLAEGLGLGGLAVAGAAAWLAVRLTHAKRPDERAGIALAPALGVDHAGLVITGGF